MKSSCWLFHLCQSRNHLCLWNLRASKQPSFFSYNIWLPSAISSETKVQEYCTEPWDYRPEPGPNTSAGMGRKNLWAAPNSVSLTIPTSHLWKLFLLLPRPAVQRKTIHLPNKALPKSRRNPSEAALVLYSSRPHAENSFSIFWNPLPLPDNLQYLSLTFKKFSLNVFLSWHVKYLTWTILSLQKSM